MQLVLGPVRGMKKWIGRLCSSSGVNPKRLCSSRLYLVLLVVARTKELNYTLISLAHTDLITTSSSLWSRSTKILSATHGFKVTL